MVGASGFEPPTSRSRTVRSDQAELCPEWEGTRILGESRRPVKRPGIACDSRRVAALERIRSMKRIFTILLALLAGTAMAQQPQPQPGFGERIEVNVNLLDAVVTDSTGHQTLGLGPGDFTVTENGTPQTIQSVDYFTNRKNVSAPESKAGFKAERTRNERYFVLFFDKPQESVLLNRLVHARGAAVSFVNNEMKPNDLVAIAGHDVRLKVYS